MSHRRPYHSTGCLKTECSISYVLKWQKYKSYITKSYGIILPTSHHLLWIINWDQLINFLLNFCQSVDDRILLKNLTLIAMKFLRWCFSPSLWSLGSIYAIHSSGSSKSFKKIWNYNFLKKYYNIQNFSFFFLLKIC